MNEPPTPTHRRQRARLRAASLVCTLGLGIVWGSCSVEKHYELLSFFFDGVPNPRALPTLASSGNPLAMRASPTYMIHEPYENERCVDCHGGGFDTLGVEPSVCLTCHEGVTSQHSYMHGPVVAMACMWCHVPHDSAYSYLLKAPVQEVCGQCHVPELLDSVSVAAHADETISCLECHSGHGGDTQFMLHGGWSETESSTPAQGGE
ncbi:MAG: cytochrome c3 family protein [Planctomycetota bacterium]